MLNGLNADKNFPVKITCRKFRFRDVISRPGLRGWGQECSVASFVLITVFPGAEGSGWKSFAFLRAQKFKSLSTIFLRRPPTTELGGTRKRFYEFK